MLEYQVLGTSLSKRLLRRMRPSCILSLHFDRPEIKLKINRSIRPAKSRWLQHFRGWPSKSYIFSSERWFKIYRNATIIFARLKFTIWCCPKQSDFQPGAKTLHCFSNTVRIYFRKNSNAQTLHDIIWYMNMVSLSIWDMKLMDLILSYMFRRKHLIRYEFISDLVRMWDLCSGDSWYANNLLQRFLRPWSRILRGSEKRKVVIYIRKATDNSTKKTKKNYWNGATKN